MENPAEQVSPALSSRHVDVPLAQRVVRGGLWVAAGSYWMIGFGFLTTLLMTRLLDAESFGIFALATFFSQLLRVQPKLGLGYAYAQHKDASPEVLATYVLSEFAATLGGLLMILLCAPALLYFGYAPVVVRVSLVLGLAAVMEGVTGIGTVLLDKELHFTQPSIVQSIAFPLSYLPAVWLAFHSAGVWSLVAQGILYNVLYCVGLWWVLRRKLPHIWGMRWRLNVVLARRFVRYGVVIGLGLMAGSLLLQVDNFLIGTFVGLTTLGYYDRAYRTAQWPSTLFSGLLSRAVFYTYARLQDDAIRLRKTVAMVLWLITSLALPLALTIFVTAPDLLVLLYGERWLPSALFLRILVVYSVVRPLWENAGTLFVAIGKPRLPTVLCFVMVLVLVAAGLPMTVLWGAVGTAVAVGLAFAVGMVVTFRYSLREVAMDMRSTLGIPLVASVLTIVGYLALSRLTVLNDPALLPLGARVAIKAVYAAAAFYMLVFLFEPRTALERLRYLMRLVLHADRPDRESS